MCQRAAKEKSLQENLTNSCINFIFSCFLVQINVARSGNQSENRIIVIGFRPRFCPGRLSPAFDV